MIPHGTCLLSRLRVSAGVTIREKNFGRYKISRFLQMDETKNCPWHFLYIEEKIRQGGKSLCLFLPVYAILFLKNKNLRKECDTMKNRKLEVKLLIIAWVLLFLVFGVNVWAGLTQRDILNAIVEVVLLSLWTVSVIRRRPRE